MNVKELIKKIEISDGKRTKEKNFKLLVQAKILDKDGFYDARFFREDTVAKSKLKKSEIQHDRNIFETHNIDM